jgi:hypothetical protein
VLYLFLTHFKEDIVKKPEAKDTKPPKPTATKSTSGKGKGTGKGNEKATSKDKKIKKNNKRTTEVASLNASSPYADDNENEEDLGRGMRHKKTKK